MSEFKTVIPFNLEAVLKQLPPGSALQPRHGVRLTPENNVEIFWYNEAIKTNASRAIEFSLDAINGKEPMPPEIIQPAGNDPVRVINEAVASKRKSKAQLAE